MAQDYGFTPGEFYTVVADGDGKSRFRTFKPEWGVFWEDVDSFTEPASSEEMARRLVAESPADRGLRVRYVTEWEEV